MLLVLSHIFFITPMLSVFVNPCYGLIASASHKTLLLLACRLMGVCLCISECARGCLCRVPSSISRLSFSDDHWSSISTHSPDWCCTVLWWKARSAFLNRQHAYYNTFSPRKREIAMLMSRGSDLNRWWAQQMPQMFLLFSNLFADDVFEQDVFFLKRMWWVRLWAAS